MGARIIFATIATTLSLVACTPAVHTEIMSVGSDNIPQKTNYIFVDPPGENSPVNIAARNLVADSLHLKNWTENASGTYAVSVTVSVLPASLEVYENDSEKGTSDRIVKRRSKKNHILRSCSPLLHRLNVKIHRIADGVELYSGNASEYHCKAEILETLPYLTNAAMADLGKLPSTRSEKRSGKN